MKAAGVIALAIVAGAGTWTAPLAASATSSAASPLETALQLGAALVKAIVRFPAAAAVSTIEAQLALVIEQSSAGSGIALQALDIAEAAPNLSPHAKTAIERLKRLIRARRHNAIAALDQGGVGQVGGGPGFAGAGGGADYNH